MLVTSFDVASLSLYTTRNFSFEVALFQGFLAEGPAIYIAQPIGLGDQA